MNANLNYLVTQIARALSKIFTNKERCAYLTKQIEASNWAKNDIELTAAVAQEFDAHIKALTTQCNSFLICAEEQDWDCLHMCLQHLAHSDIVSVKAMLQM